MTKHDWLTQVEQYLLLGSGATTAAALAMQNATLATAPLTVLVAVGLLNRNRMEQRLESAQHRLKQQQRQHSHRMANLHKQVTALPSPEAMTNFQRSVIDRNHRALVKFSQQMDHIQGQMNQQAALHGEVDQLKQQVTHLQDQGATTEATLNTLSASTLRLAHNPRLDATEARLGQVKTDVTQVQVQMESFNAEVKATLGYLQDTMTQLDRRLQNLPATLDTATLRQELTQTTKAVVTLVPRTEFANLASHVQELTRRQADLQRALTQVPLRSMAIEDGAPSPDPSPALQEMATDLKQLETLVRQLQQQVSHQATAGHTQDHVQQSVANYLGKLKAKFAQLEGVTQSLADQQRHLSQQIEHLAPDSQQSRLRQALGQVVKRLNQAETHITTLQVQAAPRPTPAAQAAAPQWIVDLPASQPTVQDRQQLPSRVALAEVLTQPRRRILLVWPWASYSTIDDSLLEQFTQALRQGSRLEIGWCHRGDGREGRLARRINQRWGTESSQFSQLKAALGQLLPLRESFPDQFKFKIIGTDESFLVSEPLSPDVHDAFAILSLKPLSAQSVAFPQADLKLRTAEPQVVQSLIHRFDHPTIAPDNTTAFFNRGTTRHDLRDQPGAIADYSEVLRLQPHHAVALNNRGVAQLELDRPAEAETDFTEAIACDAKLFAAYCNRGWLRLEHYRYKEAVADFAQAIALKPHLPMAYVYRGSALQKLGDTNAALQDYSDAIACGEPLALPYFYRSAAYQSQGDRQRAIADLESASVQLEALGDRATLSSVQRTLSRLQTLVAEQAS